MGLAVPEFALSYKAIISCVTSIAGVTYKTDVSGLLAIASCMLITPTLVGNDCAPKAAQIQHAAHAPTLLILIQARLLTNRRTTYTFLQPSFLKPVRLPRASETRSPMQALHQTDWDRLYELAEANQVHLNRASFTEALTATGQRFLPPQATRAQQLAFYQQLHLKDFALAQSCSRGNAPAWDHFVTRFRGGLYRAALAIAKTESIARDLSDSLAGDLFLNKIASYSGRGSLASWLKALLTHTYIDHYRARQRTVSLETRLDLLRTLCASQHASHPQPDPRLHQAIQQAFARRTPEERFLLSIYFFDSWTLAEVARATGVHESSVSRRLNRIVKQLRRGVTCNLRTAGMTSGQIEESFTSSILELSIDLRELLSGSDA